MNQLKNLLITALYSMMLLLSSCDYPLLEKEAPDRNTLKAGNRFRINLMEDHRKGETWQLLQDWEPGCLGILSSTWHGSDKGLDINVIALQPGNYTLTAMKRIYRDTVEVKHYFLTIVAK